MSLDIKRLESVKTKAGGKIIARCPACAVNGGDEKGEHLFVNTDGRYGCVVHQGDKAHNKTIFALVGVKDGAAAPTPVIQIRRMEIPESKVVMVIGTLKKREDESVVGNCSDEDEAEAA